MLSIIICDQRILKSVDPAQDQIDQCFHQSNMAISTASIEDIADDYYSSDNLEATAWQENGERFERKISGKKRIRSIGQFAKAYWTSFKGKHSKNQMCQKRV